MFFSSLVTRCLFFLCPLIKKCIQLPQNCVLSNCLRDIVLLKLLSAGLKQQGTTLFYTHLRGFLWYSPEQDLDADFRKNRTPDMRYFQKPLNNYQTKNRTGFSWINRTQKIYLRRSKMYYRNYKLSATIRK